MNRNRGTRARRWGSSRLIALLGVTTVAGALCHDAAAGVPVTSKYTLQAVLKRGDKVGNTSLIAQYGLEVDALNDNGQLLLETYQATEPTLFQYAGGTFTPIFAPGVAAPTPNGHWPMGQVSPPVGMNKNGNAAFAVWNSSSGIWTGTFQWDSKAGKSTAVTLNGMPAASGLTFSQAGVPIPAINNRNEIAISAEVKDASGKVLGNGLFFRGQDGSIQPIALPGQAGSDGVSLDSAYYASLSDDGRIAFLARRYGQPRPSAYLSEGGQLIPIAVVGTHVPGGGKIVEVLQAWTNNKNSEILISVVLDDLDYGPQALYRWSNGALIPVVVPGEAMPGGGQFVSLLYGVSVSFPNELGQFALYGLTAEGGVSRTAAYLLDADGSLSLIIKSGDTTELGAIARVGDPDEDDGFSTRAGGGGWGIALNSQGQVALLLKPVTGPTTLSLLTPAGP